MSNNLIPIDDIVVVHKTEKAVLIDNGKKKTWLPLSIVELSEDETSILVPYNKALDEGLI